MILFTSFDYTMKFKKGSKVEIMNKDVPASWRVAEIITSNGHGFNVRYDGYEGVEKVSRRLIRPSPPAVGLQSWSTGDIVEVFDESSWKIATVLKVLKGGRILVRLHGFSHEMKVHKSNIRARQSWIDGQWIAIGKVILVFLFFCYLLFFKFYGGEITNLFC